jgi:hypothetical protein
VRWKFEGETPKEYDGMRKKSMLEKRLNAARKLVLRERQKIIQEKEARINELKTDNDNAKDAEFIRVTCGDSYAEIAEDAMDMVTRSLDTEFAEGGRLEFERERIADLTAQILWQGICEIFSRMETYREESENPKPPPPGIPLDEHEFMALNTTNPQW